MQNKYLILKNLTSIILLFFLGTAFSQTTIKSQNFDSGASGYLDDLSYTVSNPSYVTLSSTTSESSPNSLIFSNNNGSSNRDSDVIFNNVDISSLSNVSVTVSFKAINVDNNEDLYLDISYDGGSNYDTQINLIDGDNWNEDIEWGIPDTDGTTTENPYTFDVPAGNNQIMIRIRALNLDDAEFFYVDNVLIKENKYCSANSNEPSSSSYYIRRVQMNTINNPSTDNESNGNQITSLGYSDFTSFSTDLNKGSTGNTITISPYLAQNNYNFYYRVWIDFNNDGVFNDEDEQVLSEISTGNNSNSITNSFSVPSSAVKGSTRMRIIMRYDNFPNSCGTYNHTGEVEDYTINVIATRTITTGTISPSSYCVGALVNIPYTKTGTFKNGNIFTAQLSNAAGSFASPVTIGTATSTTAGTISGTIPVGTATGNGYRIRVVSNNPVSTGTNNGNNLTISNLPQAPTTTGGQICIGSTSTLSASGSVAGDRYFWYNANSGGILLKTSTNNTDNTYITPVITSTTNYWVAIGNSSGCKSTRTMVTANFPVNSPDSQTAAGNNTWIGHVYDGTNSGVALNGNFTNYFGTYPEAEIFDDDFGENYICYPVSSSLGNRSIYSETFSVRYRMNSTKKGLYVVDLGSDDGSRLAVDGTLIYNNWSDQPWSLKPRVLMNLTGTSQLVFDFYENSGGNRVNFNNLTLILENKLTENTNQVICSGTTASAISGDTFGTLPAGLTSAGYQWTYSTSSDGPRINIFGATSASFTPKTNTAPFNNAGTYYIFRNASVSSSNNIDPNPTTQTSESNFVIVKVNGQPEGMLKVVDLGTAGDFTILSQAGITNVYESSVEGDVGASPITGAAILLTCSEVTGTIYSVNAAGPAPCTVTNASELDVAVQDMQSAYSDAAGRANPDFVDLGSGNLGGKTLTPGLYKFNSVVTIPTDMTISGGSNDIWIFQISGTFNLSSAVKILLDKGAQAKNIFWQISGAVTLGTYSHFEGNIIGKTSIAMQTGASINGRLLAQTAVTLAMNDVNGLVPPGTVFPDIENNTIGEDQTVCEGFNPQTLTGSNVTGGDGTYTYLWESSTTSNSTGFGPATGTNNSEVYNPGSLSQTTWFRRTVTSGFCMWDTSSPVKITINLPIVNNKLSFSNGISGTLCGTANEDGDVDLTAPAETVFNYVNFTSYGTPGGTCGNFTINSSCHALTSQAVSETYLLGSNTAVIPATNTVFGDPCVNTIKKLYVQAYYSQPICNGTAPGAISGALPSGGDGNYTYVWKSSITGSNSGFTTASGSNTLQNYSPGVLTQTTWFKRIVTSSNCSNESPVILISVKQDNIWTGAANIDWNNTSNWTCNSIPTLNTNVAINSGLTNYPTLNTGALGMAKNIKLQTGTSLTVLDNTLQIAGTVANGGTFDTQEGGVAFVGTVAQTIPANTFSANRIRNLIINNTANVSSSGTLEITGFLRVENGNFNTGNALTLISNTTQTALIDGSGTGEVVGLVKMQRYLDVAFGYKYFSSPFSNTSVGDFSPYIDLVDPDTSFPNFYTYDENRQFADSASTGWKAYTTANDPLDILKGYALNFGDTLASPKTVEITGTINNGDKQITLYNNDRLYTKGFNLVGNPYPSPMDWNAVPVLNRTNIDDALYFFTTGNTNMYTGTYTTYVNGIQSADGLSSNIIPSMQGFFVHVSDGPPTVTATLEFTNSVRTNNYSQQFLKVREPEKAALIRITAAFENEGKTDPAVLYFPYFSELSFEKDKDALKLMNTDIRVPNLYSITPENKKLSINALPKPGSNDVKKIPLGFKIEKDGWMLIGLKDLENLPSNFNVYLIDSEKRIGQNLSIKPQYRFYANSGQQDNRFHLMFSETELSDPAIAFDEPFSVQTVGGKVMVSLNLVQGQSGVLLASTVTGQILDKKNVSEKEVIEIEGIKSSGVYFFSINLKDGMFSKKVLIQK
jgi:hypothetical protein